MKKLILLIFLFSATICFGQSNPYKNADSLVAENSFSLLQYNRAGVNHVFYSSCRIDTLLAWMIRNGAGGGGSTLPLNQVGFGTGTSVAGSPYFIWDSIINQLRVTGKFGSTPVLMFISPAGDTTISMQPRGAIYFKNTGTSRPAMTVTQTVSQPTAVFNGGTGIQMNGGCNVVETSDAQDLILKTNSVEFARGVEFDSLGFPALKVTDIVVQGNEYLYGNVGGLWRNDDGIENIPGVLTPTYYTRDTTIDVQEGYRINGSDALRQDGNSGNLSIGIATPNPVSISGTDNVSIGQNVLNINNSGLTNVIIGNNSMALNTDGSENSTVGHAVLPQNTTGSFNSVIGGFSMANNVSGSLNSVVGDISFNNNISGYANSVLGGFAANNVTTDSFRLYIQAFSEYIKKNGAGFIDSTSHLIYGNSDSLHRHIQFNAPVTINDGTQGAGKVLTSDANGLGSWQTPSGISFSDTTTTIATTTALVDSINSLGSYYGNISGVFADTIKNISTDGKFDPFKNTVSITTINNNGITLLSKDTFTVAKTGFYDFNYSITFQFPFVSNNIINSSIPFLQFLFGVRQNNNPFPNADVASSVYVNGFVDNPSDGYLLLSYNIRYKVFQQLVAGDKYSIYCQCTNGASMNTLYYNVDDGFVEIKQIK